jgi:hypothetical protein
MPTQLAPPARFDRVLLWIARGAIVVCAVVLVLWAVSLWRVPTIPLGGNHYLVCGPASNGYLARFGAWLNQNARSPSWQDWWEGSIRLIHASPSSISSWAPIRIGPVVPIFRCRTIVGLFGALAAVCLLVRRYRRRPTRGFVIAQEPLVAERVE